MKLKLNINQRVYVKKNSRRFIQRGGKRFSIPSAGYERSKITIINEIVNQLDSAGVKPEYPALFKTPIHVETEFWIKGKSRVDADNLHTSILDILQAAHVIEDDFLVFEGEYSKHLGATDWRCEVTIKSL